MAKTEPVKPSEVSKMIPAKKVKSLAASYRATKKNTAEIAGVFAAEVKEAIERHGIDRRALRVFFMADSMEPERLRKFRDDLDYLFDVGGIDARADAVQPMTFEEGKAPEEGNPTVAPFPAPRSVAAE